jgi:hypothetical protein
VVPALLGSNRWRDFYVQRAEQYEAEAEVRYGGGEFIGNFQEEGTDREQRDSARAVYEGNIRQSPVPAKGARAIRSTARRPRVDTLKGSKHQNMKELRFDAGDGVWRVAFAFDPQRQAILLVAGDKSGQSERIFYRRLIAKADTRFAAHLKRLRK